MKRVLVVDDSVDTINLIKMVFADENTLQLDYAYTSKEAIDLFNINQYNACVLDVSLPDITGYYLGKLIRDVCSDMPIAFLTNYEGEYTKENASDIKADFWAKGEVFAAPMGLRDLIKTLAGNGNCIPQRKIVMPEIFDEFNEEEN